ncbi:SemiSWEET family transporter [Bifidobacterium crudilactis]|jgi:uncharacterized protein with PQ loop repeat|uniref:SemiSWEET family transporter n=1 Tax=Bifidobacterium crudilactis TaxID=327277 RepID=UPI0023578BC5|nr:SemiSWEET family transporter [Bifidobacterium crudilactis]MCI1218680.1 SWEET family sugar transporter [Bifidobacterium crudilactis]MCI1637481.1 SWEET family sugar transporter [Bifidobacterium crudilactis]MCI1664731.1 SWEET family sugar transporter [Bifidobacterium crudilactis]MCI1888941.1 SWEET family sugar transporter [Bifidobacterium crudilactis]
MEDNVWITRLSWAATIMGILMYVSYIPQIMNNLSGDKGSPIQPLVAVLNCSLWVAYGLLKKPKDYPIAITNAPGIVFGLVACITAL